MPVDPINPYAPPASEVVGAANGYELDPGKIRNYRNLAIFHAAIVIVSVASTIFVIWILIFTWFLIAYSGMRLVTYTLSYFASRKILESERSMG